LTKIERCKKLLAFLELKEFVAPIPLPEEVHEDIYKRMVQPLRLRMSDHTVVRIGPEEPITIRIWCAEESRHNGSFYDEVREDLAITDVVLDFAISVLTNRASNKIDEQFKREEYQTRHNRCIARLKELELLE
jgi:hypothetical protein